MVSFLKTKILPSIFDFYHQYQTFIKVLLTILFFFLIIEKINYQEVQLILKAPNKVFLTISFIFLLAGIFISFIRWYFICEFFKIQIKLKNSFLISSKSNFFGQLLPSSFGGDLYKLIYLKKKKFSTKKVFKTIIYDRASGLIFLFFFLLLTSIEFLDLSSFYYLVILSFPIVIIIICLKKILNSNESKKSIYNYVNLALILSFASQFFTISFFYFVCKSIDTNLSFIEISFISSLSLILSTIPITIGGWGLRETSFSYLMGYYFMNSTEGVLISLSYGICLILIAIIFYLSSLIITSRYFQKT